MWAIWLQKVTHTAIESLGPSRRRVGLGRDCHVGGGGGGGGGRAGYGSYEVANDGDEDKDGVKKDPGCDYHHMIEIQREPEHVPDTIFIFSSALFGPEMKWL